MYQPEIETLPLNNLRRLQGDRLTDLLHRVNRQVPFYQNRFAEKGVDISSIREVEAINKLPFTTKEDLRLNYPFNLLAVPQNEVLRVHASSGTTGKPTVVCYNAHDLTVFDEVVARSLVCAGAKPGMKLHNAYGYGLFTGGLGMHGGATKLGMSVIPVSGGMTDRQLMILQDFKPEVICCTPSYALTLGYELQRRNISLDQINLSHAVLGAEPWTEAIREEVERLLGVNATNIYGLSEIIGPGVSQEAHDEHGSGSYVWEDHFYPEIVNRDTGEPLPYGEEGVLVFTTLTKQAMPLIRYWTNDICSLHYDPAGSRTHVKMGAIKGRADDMLIIRGVNLFLTQIEELLLNFAEASAHYFLTVRREKSLDHAELEVELIPEYYQSGTSLPGLENAIANKIKSVIGLSMQVLIKPSGTLPRSAGGKLKRVDDQRTLL